MPQSKMSASLEAVRAPLAAWGLGHLVQTLGRPSFEDDLAKFLFDACGAEFVHICTLPDEQPQIRLSCSQDGSREGYHQSGAYVENRMWCHDPSMHDQDLAAPDRMLLRRLDTNRAENRELQDFYQSLNIRERVVVYGSGPACRIGLSIVRSATKGVFSAEECRRIGVLGEIAFPLLARHFSLLDEDRHLTKALTSLDTIEACLAVAPGHMPRREAEVAARMLYGLSTEGIALDLDLSPETIVSYRKRVYRRLGISGLRELVLWYLDQYGQSRHRLLH